MKNLFLIFAVIIFYSFAKAQDSTYYVGHSLINVDVPYQTWRLLDQNNEPHFYKHHINIGASIKLNWIDTGFNSNTIWDAENNVNEDRGTNHLVELQNPYDHIVITEAIPIENYPVDTTVKYVSNFYNLARTSNPNITRYMYATWEYINGDEAAWRDTIEALVPHWEQIADECALASGGGEVYIVPGNLGMMALYDTLQNRNIGSFSSISDFFEPDGVHLNGNGNYFIACLMMATVNHSNPIGLDVVEAGPYSNDTVIMDDVARLEIQQIALDVVCNYDRTGVPADFCGMNDTSTIDTFEMSQTIFVNDTTLIIDSTIIQDSIYLSGSDTITTSYYSNDTLFFIDSVYNHFILLRAPVVISGLHQVEELNFTIYPNPANSYFDVELEIEETIIGRLINMNGQVVKEDIFTTNRHRVNIADINRGIYIYEVRSPTNVLTKKIVIK
ncbi:MAG: T9SS type A sorting domain-containing protein [Chitinophagales bacterium]